MKNLLMRFWVKVRLAVIIILSITIGASYAIAIPKYLELKNIEENVWNEHLQRQSNGIGESVKEITPPKTESFVPIESAEVHYVASREAELNSLPSTSIEELIKKTWNNEEEAKIALAIAKAESRLNPKVTNTNRNGTIDCGIFQINSIHKLENCQDPKTNIHYAFGLFQRHGWQPWNVWKNKKYLVFL